MFSLFLKDNPFLKIKQYTKIGKTGKYDGKIYVITGTRDPILLKYLEDNGATIGINVNRSTSAVLVKDPNSMSNKIQKAISLGIPIMDIAQFKN